MDSFLERYHVINLYEGQINYLCTPITTKEIEAIIQSLPNQMKNTKSQEKMVLVQNSSRPSKNS